MTDSGGCKHMAALWYSRLEGARKDAFVAWAVYVAQCEGIVSIDSWRFSTASEGIPSNSSGQISLNKYIGKAPAVV